MNFEGLRRRGFSAERIRCQGHAQGLLYREDLTLQAAPRSIAVALVAGETSGDLLAGLLLDGCRSAGPTRHSFGIGGPQMAARGFEAWWPSDGWRCTATAWRCCAACAKLLGIRKQLRSACWPIGLDVFIGVDAPDFNLDLEADLRAAGIKTVHFVCPSIWAWRGERVEKIRRSADHVLCIFPFEPRIAGQHGIARPMWGIRWPM
jgi:lipid-A-disaccharide synthase